MQPRGVRAVMKMKNTKSDPELIDGYKYVVSLLLISFIVTTNWFFYIERIHFSIFCYFIHKKIYSKSFSYYILTIYSYYINIFNPKEKECNILKTDDSKQNLTWSEAQSNVLKLSSHPSKRYTYEIFIVRIRDCSKVFRSYLSPSSYGIVPPANSSAWWTSKCRKSCRATSK